MRQIAVHHSMSLPRESSLFRVASIGSIATAWMPDIRFLVRCTDLNDLAIFRKLCGAGLHNLTALVPVIDQALLGGVANVVADNSALEFGDVVTLTGGSSAAHVLFRASDDHHTVFLTSQCDNYCLMCSQPPHDNVDDTYLVDEAIALSRYISAAPAVIGFSGGEPLLLGSRLRKILDVYRDDHQNTLFEVLTNGRRLADHSFAQQLLSQLGDQVSWMIPLYGHADFLHDFVVQRHGAFDETLAGILNLQEFEQSVQLRVVLIEPTLEEIEEICRFISTNLPFIQSMAFMGCEPTGFALANRSICDLDLEPYLPALLRATRMIERAGIRPIIMNIPNCRLSEGLRRFAAKSISNWKQRYDKTCAECGEYRNCGGYFSWQAIGWSSVRTTPFTEAQ